MDAYEGARFVALNDRGHRAPIENIRLVRCSFVGSGLSATDDVRRRSLIRNVEAIGCEVDRVVVGPAVFEEVLVDGLGTPTPLQVRGAAFRHVTLRGRIGRLMLSPKISPAFATVRQQAAVDRANSNYYRDVDWALDISEASFREGQLTGVPAELVKRDPATQFVVRREVAQRGAWRELRIPTLWSVALEQIANGTSPDEVLVVPRQHPRFRDLLDGIRRLQDCGVVEPSS